MSPHFCKLRTSTRTSRSLSSIAFWLGVLRCGAGWRGFFGAVFAGVAFHGIFIEPEAGEGFWRGSMFWDAHLYEELHHVPLWVKLSPAAAMLLGFFIAWRAYLKNPALPAAFTSQLRVLYRFLLRKWYFDELYDRIFVRPSVRLARALWQVGDAKLIDGVPNGIAALTEDGSAQVVRIQTGSIAVYAFTMLIGLVMLVGIYLLFR